jgi:uncharacterized protein
MNRPAFVRFLRAHFALDWRGIHGAPHWARVRHNGLELSSRTGANTRVVEAFAFLHDSCRRSDGGDPEHGYRAGELATRINDEFLRLDTEELALLVYACQGHSSGQLEGDLTVQTCWDADRLDLGRVGIRPVAARLCTSAARDPSFIAWAYARSLMRSRAR